MRYCIWRGLIAVLTVLCAVGSADAKRVALVVGNDSYQNLPDLQKAVNDARAVGAALDELGFNVIGGENLTRREMNRHLADLEAAIAPGDQVFFFYAGHGIAIASENLMLPVDMLTPKSGEESLVIDEAIPTDVVIRRIQLRGAAVAFVVLDACRDNPFAESGTRGIGTSRGLMRIDAPSGVFVLFSAGIGQTALDRLSDDDSDPNSIFTRRLVPLLRTRGLTHVAIAKRVQSEVIDLAATVKHRQEPAYYDQVKGEIVLLPGDTKEPIVNRPPDPATPVDDPVSAKTDPLAITVLKTGEVYIGETRVAFDDLDSALKAIAETSNRGTDEPVFVRGRADTDYGTVMKVVARLSAAGFNKVSLVTDSDDTSAKTSGDTGKNVGAILTIQDKQALIAALRKQISRCWSPPGGAGSAELTTVRLAIELDERGNLRSKPRTLKPETSPAFLIAEESAVRAVYDCQPFTLPPEHYSSWRSVNIKFDPMELLMGGQK